MGTHSDDTKQEHLFKILVIGDSATGKTCFIRRYVQKLFSKNYRATIGVDFALKAVRFKGMKIRMQIWDIAGEERFIGITSAYYRNASGAFIVFDASNQKTFQSVLKWKSDLDNKVRLSDGSTVPCLLLANKCDLVKDIDKANDFLAEFAKENGFIGYLYTSPMMDLNVKTAFGVLVEEILLRKQSLDQSDFDNGYKIVLTNQSDSQPNTRNENVGGCC